MHVLINEWPSLETVRDVQSFFIPQRIRPARQSACRRLSSLVSRVWSIVKDPFELLFNTVWRGSCGRGEESSLQKIATKLKTKQVWARMESLISKAYWRKDLLVPTINAIRESDLNICVNPLLSHELITELYSPEPVLVEEGPLKEPTEICLGASLWFIKLLFAGKIQEAEKFYLGAPIQGSALQWLYSKVRIQGTDHAKWIKKRSEFSETIGSIKDTEKQKKRIEEQIETELQITKAAKLEIEELFCCKPQTRKLEVPEGVYLVKVPKHAAVYYKVSENEGYIFNIDYGLIKLKRNKDQWAQLVDHFKGYNVVPFEDQYLHLLRLAPALQ